MAFLLCAENRRALVLMQDDGFGDDPEFGSEDIQRITEITEQAKKITDDLFPLLNDLDKAAYTAVAGYFVCFRANFVHQTRLFEDEVVFVTSRVDGNSRDCHPSLANVVSTLMMDRETVSGDPEDTPQNGFMGNIPSPDVLSALFQTLHTFQSEIGERTSFGPPTHASDGATSEFGEAFDALVGGFRELDLTFFMYGFSYQSEDGWKVQRAFSDNPRWDPAKHVRPLVIDFLLNRMDTETLENLDAVKRQATERLKEPFGDEQEIFSLAIGAIVAAHILTDF